MTKESNGLVANKEEDLMPGFVITLLKNRITSLESQLLRKDTIIEYLLKQLISSNSLKSQSIASKSHVDRNGSFKKIYTQKESNKLKLSLLGTHY